MKFIFALVFISVSFFAGAQNKILFHISAKNNVNVLPSGRMFIFFSRDEKVEPRFSVNAEDKNHSGYVFATDVQWNRARLFLISDSLVGFPLSSIDDLDSGNYFVQALYDTDTFTFSRNAPGNLYSQPIVVHFKPNRKQTIILELRNTIEQEKIADSKYARYVKLKSRILSDFWHRTVYVQASVLLPRDYDSFSSKKYPVRYNIGGYGARYTRVQKYLNDTTFLQMWLSAASPEMLMVFLDADAPFGDSYQMNSENNGPYMDILLKELIPYIETTYHAMGTARSRFLDGGSTGGWVALALQIFNPDFFNGCWSFYSDPVDFHFFQLVNIYEDRNAFVNRFGNENPSSRTVHGEVMSTMRSEVNYENVLGRHNSYITSGIPWGAWNAVYSPRGLNGLPKPIWDASTGAIDRNVAEHWKLWDLKIYLEKNWKIIGSKLQGKLHIWMGDMDTYYLNNSMRLLQDFLINTESPKSDAHIVFGTMQVHNWEPLSEQEKMKQMMERLKE